MRIKIKRSENKQKMTLGGSVKEKFKAAMRDTDFKKALVNNPKETLAQIGVEFPEEFDIKIVSKPKSKVMYLVFPDSPDELTNESIISKNDSGQPLVVCMYCPFHP